MVLYGHMNNQFHQKQNVGLQKKSLINYSQNNKIVVFDCCVYFILRLWLAKVKYVYCLQQY